MKENKFQRELLTCIDSTGTRGNGPHLFPRPETRINHCETVSHGA